MGGWRWWLMVGEGTSSPSEQFQDFCHLSPHKPPLGSAHPERTPQCTQRLLHRSTASALTEEIKRLARGRRREATGIGRGAGRGVPGGRTFSFTLG